jgi:5-methylcytosine-specific restriction endonuclease McrA
MSLCKDCGINERYVYLSGKVNSYCKECGNKRSKEHYKKNKESALKRVKEYYQTNKDSVLKYQKEYYEDNKDYLLSYHKAYRESNRDVKIGYYRQYYKENKQAVSDKKKENYQKNKHSILNKTKKYKKLNPDVARRSNTRRRARKLDNGFESYTEEQVLNLYGNNCHICNIGIDLLAPRQAGAKGWEMGLHIDHVVPISRGGPDTLDNVRPSHGKCNLSKSSKF